MWGGGNAVAAWRLEDVKNQADLRSGEEITQRLLCSQAGTWAGRTWQLGSAGSAQHVSARGPGKTLGLFSSWWPGSQEEPSKSKSP